MAKIMLIGAGDLGVRVGTALLLREKVDEMTLVDLPKGGGPAAAEAFRSCSTIPIHFEGVNCLDTSAVEAALRKRRPDLIVFGASLRTSMAVMTSKDPRGKAMWEAGMGTQFAFQLPLIVSVMRAVKTVAPDTPVANFTIPDTSHKVLAGGGLLPTAGLGNPAIIKMRIESNLARSGVPAAEVPFVRVIGSFAHNVNVIYGVNPGDRNEEPWIFLGDDGTRADTEVIYMGEDLFNALPMNYATMLSSLPTIESLLPDGPECRTSVPGAFGLFGGFPVKIANGKMEVDLPPGVTEEEAIAFTESGMPGTGIERYDDDGTIHYTEKAIRLMADVDPRLTEPYNAFTDTERTKIVLDLMNDFKS